MAEFDLVETPLQGRVVIEANAGTGKTYSIAHIYLRLLLERGLAVEQILVLTFTRAASAELKQRIHAVLSRAAAVLAGSERDPLIERWCQQHSDRLEQAQIDLARALRRFDLAVIDTIHGFCQRALNETSMFSAFDPDRRVGEPDRRLIGALSARAWRQISQQFTLPFAIYLKRNKIQPETLVATVMEVLFKPQVKTIWPTVINDEEVAALESRAFAAWQQVRSAWRENEDQLQHASAERKRLQQVLNWWQTHLSKPHAYVDLINEKKVAPVLKAVPRLVAPVTSYVMAQAALLSAYDGRAATLPLNMAEAIKPLLTDYQQRRRIYYFDDLPAQLATALRPTGSPLRSLLQQRYSAALVDEFQDTDPLQYEILSHMYAGCEHPCILVGDPKQALYAFRGADIFAYLNARDDARNCYILSTNWRATRPLLASINALFSSATHAFVLPQIGYRPSQPAPVDVPSLVIDSEHTSQHLVCWRLPTGGASKSALQRQVAQATAQAVADLLRQAQQGHARFGDDPVRADDIAILVRTHHQGRLIAQALAEAGVNYVLAGTESVYATDQAEELQRFLHAIVYPQAAGAIAAALSTDLYGLTSSQLHSSESQHQDYYGDFAGYLALWHQQGIAAVLMKVMQERYVVSRWLKKPDGPRRLTNLYHLLELLQQASLSNPAQLLHHLATQRYGADQRAVSEEELLRLESDQDVVQVVTIHKAKGLQFAVVYCPYSWDASTQYERLDSAVFHTSSNGQYELWRDFGGADYADHCERALQEGFAEDVRLLYVALTRAIARCYFVWGPAPGAQYAALRYLLHGQGNSWRDGITLVKEDAAVAASRACEHLQRLGIGVLPLPQADAGQHGHQPEVAPMALARKASIRPPTAWAAHSFSSIVASLGGAHTEQAWRGSDDDATGSGAATDIFTLPGGMQTGSMLHEVLEMLPAFDCDVAVLKRCVGTKTAQFGIDRRYHTMLAEHLYACLRTPIDDKELQLCQLQAGSYVRELAFTFTTEGLSLKSLIDALRQAEISLSTHGTDLVSGYLRGYIDLIFCHNDKYYIVDYKSNYLGRHLEDYAPAGLKADILSQSYDIQYLLYTLALHRYLRQRLPGYDYESCFGGVYYLYLRGMRRELGSRFGVYFDRPTEPLVSGLDRLFGGVG